MKQIVIVGLGNPGKKYEHTRHNMGYLVVRGLASKLGLQLKSDKSFDAYIGRGEVDGIMVHLLLPTTFMNLSGLSVKRYLDFYKLNVENVVVAADDIALSFGEIRLRSIGSAGGHNGLKSVEAHLGTRNYVRLRMGIGYNRPTDVPEYTLADYVLDIFSPVEKIELPAFIERGMNVLIQLMHESIDDVMHKVNAKHKNKKEGLKDTLIPPQEGEHHERTENKPL